MKKVFLIIIFCFFSAWIFAQVSFYPKTQNLINDITSNEDTLGYSYYLSNTWGVLQYNPAGYVFGNNLYKDKAKIQVYNLSEPHQIQSIIVGFGLKRFNSLDSNSHVSLRLYNLDKTGFANGGSKPSPGTYFYSKNIPLYTIDTANLTLFTVDSFAQSIGSFGVGVDFSGLNPLDTLVLLSTGSGNSISAQSSWEISLQNENNTILNSWGFDATPALFPVAISSTVVNNIVKDDFKLKLTHNSIQILSNLKGKYEILDVTGKIVKVGTLNIDQKTIYLNNNSEGDLLIFKFHDTETQKISFRKLVLPGIK